MSFIFVALAITLISYDNTVLAKVIAEIWEHNDITKKKSPPGEEMNSSMIQQVLKNPAV